MAQYEINNIPAPIDFSGGGTFVTRTLQNAKNLIMLKKGELPYDRLRGVDPALYDLSIDEMNEVIAPEIDRVLLWEPDVELISARAEMNENTSVVIYAVVSIDEEEE